MDPNLSCLNLIQEPGDVLIVLALRLGKPWILTNTLQAHLDANLTTHGSDRRYLFRIRLTSGKLKHISQIKRRISYRVRIKGHTIHQRYDIQDIRNQITPCLI